MMRISIAALRAALYAGAAIPAVAMPAPAVAQSPAAAVDYDLPAQALSDRLRAIARLSGREIIFSAERPAGYDGNWSPILPDTDTMMVRYVALDWAKERDPQISIECLDKVPLKPKLNVDQVMERIRLMAGFPGRYAKVFMEMQKDIKASVGVNKFQPAKYQGSLSRQLYLPAVFQFDEDAVSRRGMNEGDQRRFSSGSGLFVYQTHAL